MIVEYLPGGDLLSFMLKSRQYRLGEQCDGEPITAIENNVDIEASGCHEQQPNATTSYTAEGSFLKAKDLLTFAVQISQGMEHVSSLDVSCLFISEQDINTIFLAYLLEIITLVYYEGEIYRDI